MGRKGLRREGLRREGSRGSELYVWGAQISLGICVGGGVGTHCKYQCLGTISLWSSVKTGTGKGLVREW
jgi:hypothetical protein